MGTIRYEKIPEFNTTKSADINLRRPPVSTKRQIVEPFVKASAAAEFMHYSARSIKQMAREGRIPAHPFGSGVRKRWYFLISELAEHLRGQVNSAHGEAGRDKTQRMVI
jgi:Helix-turn-helix domain